MEPDYWIGELGRLYERSLEAIENEYSKAVEPLSEEFNEALEQLKSEFSGNEIIANTEPVDAYTEDSTRSVGKRTAISPSRRRDEALHEIRSRCEKIANALSYELPEHETGRSRADQMIMVSVDSDQETIQEVNHEVTSELIMQLIDIDPQVQSNKEEVKDLVQKFEEELESQDPDPNLLRQFIEKAKDESTSVAAKMSIQALQSGIVGILGL